MSRFGSSDSSTPFLRFSASMNARCPGWSSLALWDRLGGPSRSHNSTHLLTGHTASAIPGGPGCSSSPFRGPLGRRGCEGLSCFRVHRGESQCTQAGIRPSRDPSPSGSRPNNGQFAPALADLPEQTRSPRTNTDNASTGYLPPSPSGMGRPEELSLCGLLLAQSDT